MTSKPTTPRRSWLRPRYSLRVLLLAFTAFAIGFPIWYRWPYQETKSGQIGQRKVSTTTTWQRQWGGGRLKHGPERVEYGHQEWVETNYWKDLKQGPLIWKINADSKPFIIGHYDHGEKHGAWSEGSLDTSPVTIHYDHGRIITPPTPAQSPSTPESPAPASP
jgi:hypothetical protein